MIRLTPIVRHLVIINVVVFIILNLSIMRQMPFLEYLFDFFWLQKSDLLFVRERGAGFMPLQTLGWFFAHVDFMHILFNMLTLASIGPTIESVLGSKRFLRFYMFCGIFGGFLTAIVDPSDSIVLGASGAISGVLAAFAILFPRQKISFFFLPPTESRYLIGGIAILSFLLVIAGAIGSNLGGLGGISHFGHLSGMIAAVIYFYGEKNIPFLRK